MKGYMMPKRLTSALLFAFLILCVGESYSQQETAVGTFLFNDLITIMPAGPGNLAFLRADEKIPGNPIEMFLYDLETGE
jgi:hypothetical protein